MSAPPSDAFVFFGATGDLAFKQIFPSLARLIKDEGLNVPIIGVSRTGSWTSSRSAPRTAWSSTAAWIRRPIRS